jgi:glycosyltransferase involved in cell wall biosynthesis
MDMKIVHVTNFLPGYHKQWGGAEQAAYRVIKLLQKKGQRNIIFTLKTIKKIDEFEYYEIPTVEDYFGEKVARLVKRPFDFVAYRSCYKLLKKIRPDVVHLHNFARIGFSVIAAAKKLRIPVIFSLYDLWCVCPTQMLIKPNGDICKQFQGPWCINCLGKKKDFLQKTFVKRRREIFDKYFFRNLNKIIALSNSSSKQLQDYGFEKKKISVVPLPLETKKLKKVKTEKNSILYVGWLVRRKGLHVVLEAMPHVLKKINAKLYVIGSYDPCQAWYEKKVSSIIEKYDLGKKVIFVGKKPYKEVEKFLQKTNVVVVPEQWDISLATFLNEAMMFEKPIVASRIGGIPMFLKDKKAGLLARHNNPKDFAEKIIWLLKNQKKARQMAKRARKDIIAIVNENKVYQGLINTYESIVISRK